MAILFYIQESLPFTAPPKTFPGKEYRMVKLKRPFLYRGTRIRAPFYIFHKPASVNIRSIAGMGNNNMNK
jgi:hypothetical protein